MDNINVSKNPLPPQQRAIERARVGRWLQRALLGVLALALLLAGTGLVYQSLSEASDVRRYPPCGQRVDVGGYRLHLYCMGEGSPTVILESGLGGPALEWAAVQPGVAQMTHVCSYDRAGYGWSDPASPGTPRTSQSRSSV